MTARTVSFAILIFGATMFGKIMALAMDLTTYTRDPIFLRWAAETWPGGSKLLPVIDGQWRVIERSNELSTSTCLDRPTTPLCALEAYEACELRGEYEICAAAYNRVNPYVPRRVADKIELHSQIRVVMTRVLSSQDIRDWNTHHQDQRRWRAGDVAIGYLDRACYDPFEDEATRDCENPKRLVNLAVLRRAGPVWFLFSIDNSNWRFRRGEFR